MRSLIISVLIIGIVGCQSHPASTKTINSSGQQTVTNTYKTQKTIRYTEKVSMVNSLCTLQSNNHDKQRVMFEYPDVIANGVEIKGKPVYNPAIPPFNMEGCIEEGMRLSGERIALSIIGATRDILTIGAKGYAAVKVAEKIMENQGVEINNTSPDANIAVGTDNAPATINQDNRTGQTGDGSNYNPCAGEIDPATGQCVVPIEEEMEEGQEVVEETTEDTITDEATE